MNMRDLIRIASILALAVALAAVGGCALRQQPEREIPRETTSDDLAIVSEDRLSEPPPTECTSEMVAKLDVALRQLTSYYAFDKHRLIRKNRKLLSKSRLVLESHPLCPIYVLGHADPQGVEPYNDHLSQQRVESVLRFLERLGIDTGRLEARPYGERYPAADGRTLIDRARNRRVELRARDPYAS